MLAASQQRFAHHPAVEVVDHDLAGPLPADLGPFDAIVSALVIHHFGPERRLELYREVFSLLRSGGVFADLDLVRSATEVLHDRFIALVPWDRMPDRAWDRHPSVIERLDWLAAAGFDNVECVWKWRELVLTTGERRDGR